MRLTPVPRAAGLRLARDLPRMAGGLPLLARGATVSDRYIRALVDHGIRCVWVEDELSAGIEPAELLPEPERAGAEAAVRRVHEAARAAYASSRALPSDALRELPGVTAELVDLAAAAAGTTVGLIDIAPAERWTHRHPVNRAALGLLLATELFHRHGWVDTTGARQFERAGERLALLGLGLLLADIGNVAVPAEVLNRPGPPSEAEWALIRRHPEAGVALLRRARRARASPASSPTTTSAPTGPATRGACAAEDIHQFAAIAAVADVFAAMTAERPYRAALPPQRRGRRRRAGRRDRVRPRGRLGLPPRGRAASAGDGGRARRRARGRRGRGRRPHAGRAGRALRRRRAARGHAHRARGVGRPRQPGGRPPRRRARGILPAEPPPLLAAQRTSGGVP